MSMFSDPAAPGGDKLPTADLNGALLLIDVHAYETDVPTSIGPSDAIRADVAVLDGPHKAEVFDNTLLFQKVLRGQLRGQVGQKVLGRLGQGQAQPGKSAPWQLAPATDADREVGTKYLAYVASRQPVATVPAAGAGGSSTPFGQEEPFVRDATVADI